MAHSIYSVIIAGGKGTRFWPLSRVQRPKQLLKILSNKSLIQETADRVYALGGHSKTIVVTIKDQLQALRRNLPGLPAKNFLAEPQGRNTAPCIGLAALEILRRDPDGVMIVLPADHWVADAKSFQRTLRAAVALASKHDRLVTIGIRPEYPETGYGYIVKGQRAGAIGRIAAYQVTRFAEKPTLGKAKLLLRQKALWNSGIFVWRAATLLQLLTRYQPEMGAALARIATAAGRGSLAQPSASLRRIIDREYGKMINISIDYAVLEHAGAEARVMTVEGNFGWSDVGSWSAVHRKLAKDRDGNAGRGRWLHVGARNCLVQADDRLVVLLGTENTVVVDTNDALMVANLDRAQDVRAVVELLEQQGLGVYTVK